MFITNIFCRDESIDAILQTRSYTDNLSRTTAIIKMSPHLNTYMLRKGNKLQVPECLRKNTVFFLAIW